MKRCYTIRPGSIAHFVTKHAGIVAFAVFFVMLGIR